MGHILRLKLQCLCSSRLLSPAHASKLRKSPDPRLVSWRWYGEGALLEDHCNSSSEIDGGSIAANQEDYASNELEGTKGGATKRAPPTRSLNGLDSANHLDLSLGKLTNLVPDKGEAKLNNAPVEKGSTDQTQVDLLATEGSSKSAKDDKWQQVVSNVRTMALKKKLKSDNAENWGSPKTEQIESELDFTDLDLPQAGGQYGVSQERLGMNMGGKNLKQKNIHSQGSNQQKSKDTKPLSFSFLKSLDDKTSHHLEGLKSIPLDFSKETRAFSESVKKPLSEIDKSSESESDFVGNNRSKSISKKSLDEFEHELLFDLPESSRTLFSAVKTNFKYKNQRLPANRTEGLEPLYSKLSKDSIDTFFTEKGRIPSSTREAAQQPSSNENGVSKLFKGSDDALITEKGRMPSSTREASQQPSSNDNSVSRQTYMVCVQNLPPSSNPASVKASMAFYGEVTGFFKKPVRSDRLNVYIQFKTSEAMESALAAKKLQFGSKTCFIVRADHSVFTTVVRISKVSNDTDESQLRSVCEEYGKVDDVRKRAYGVFDVFYDVNELTSIPSILSSLNEVKLNRNTLFALPAPILHPSVQKEALKTPEGQSWHDIQVNQAINRIEAGLDVVSVLFEDLKELTSVAKEYSK